METPHSRREAGAALETARRRARVSQRELARRASISETWYRALTKGLRAEDPQPASDEVWVRLAQEVGASVPEIFSILGRALPDDWMTEDSVSAHSDQPDAEPGMIHDERGPRPSGLRLGERLRWQVLDEHNTLEYRLDYDDGSGAAMVVRAGTPREQVLDWLRADIEMARGMQ